jgi:hypothetical protein
MFFGYYRIGLDKPLQVQRETAATIAVYINQIRVLEESDYPAHYRQLYTGGPISSGLAAPGYKEARPLVTINEEFLALQTDNRGFC